MNPVTARVLAVRGRMAALGDRGRERLPLLRRVPPLQDLLELTARVGYGAQGFVYISMGAMALLAATDLTGSSVSTLGVFQIVAKQPFGRIWLILLGLGLLAFVTWRILQSVFDADRQGWSPRALVTRLGQLTGAVVYGVLAVSVFRFLDRLHRTSPREETATARDLAHTLLGLPFGHWLLVLIGLVILALGVGNIVTGVRRDFARTLACDEETCRRVVPIARVGYVGWGLAYLPLGLFVVLGGLRTRAAEVLSFGDSLNALERQPGGSLVLSVTAVGIIAFGAFALVEARFRRIHPPRELKNPLESR